MNKKEYYYARGKEVVYPQKFVDFEEFVNDTIDNKDGKIVLDTALEIMENLSNGESLYYVKKIMNHKDIPEELYLRSLYTAVDYSSSGRATDFARIAYYSHNEQMLELFRKVDSRNEKYDAEIKAQKEAEEKAKADAEEAE